MNDGTLDAVETEASGRVCIHFLDVSFLGNTMVRLILLTLMAPDAAIVCWKPLRGSVCCVAGLSFSNHGDKGACRKTRALRVRLIAPREGYVVARFE